MFLALAYVGINLIAKKAILASLISIALSAYVAAARKFLSQRADSPHDVYDTDVSHRGGGWDAAMGVGYGHAQGSHSSSVAHTLAYGTRKVFRK